MQVSDFPYIQCSCNVKVFGRELTDYAVAESKFKAGGSSRVLYSEVPTSERIMIELQALDIGQFRKLEKHWKESFGLFGVFKVPIKRYASNIRGSAYWLKEMAYIDGLWRYEAKPDTPPPQPEGLSYTVKLISEN